MKRKRNFFDNIEEEKGEEEPKNRKIEVKRDEALRKLTEKEKKQYEKYKNSFFTSDQINYIFNKKKPKNVKFVGKLLKTYIIDIAVESKKINKSCRYVVKEKKIF